MSCQLGVVVVTNHIKGLTKHIIVGAQLNDDLVVLVAEAHALHVSAVVIPHLAELQLHGHLHTKVFQVTLREQMWSMNWRKARRGTLQILHIETQPQCQLAQYIYICFASQRERPTSTGTKSESIPGESMPDDGEDKLASHITS